MSHGSRPGSSTYSVTTAGRERLVRMLAQPDAPGPRRDGLVLRLFFGRTLGPDACRARAVIAWADAALATMESERALFLR